MRNWNLGSWHAHVERLQWKGELVSSYLDHGDQRHFFSTSSQHSKLETTGGDQIFRGGLSKIETSVGPEAPTFKLDSELELSSISAG